MNPKSGRLQTRIARYIAFAVVASLVLSLLVLVVFRHRFVQRNMENSAQTYALLVSERLVDQVAFLGIEGRSILEQEVAELRQLNPDIERLEVVDVRGRVVRRLLAPSAAGQIRWNGTLESGAEAPAGVYFIRVRYAETTLIRRVTRIGG